MIELIKTGTTEKRRVQALKISANSRDTCFWMLGTTNFKFRKDGVFKHRNIIRPFGPNTLKWQCVIVIK